MLSEQNKAAINKIIAWFSGPIVLTLKPSFPYPAITVREPPVQIIYPASYNRIPPELQTWVDELQLMNNQQKWFGLKDRIIPVSLALPNGNGKKTLFQLGITKALVGSMLDSAVFRANLLPTNTDGSLTTITRRLLEIRIQLRPHPLNNRLRLLDPNEVGIKFIGAFRQDG